MPSLERKGEKIDNPIELLTMHTVRFIESIEIHDTV